MIYSILTLSRRRENRKSIDNFISLGYLWVCLLKKLKCRKRGILCLLLLGLRSLCKRMHSNVIAGEFRVSQRRDVEQPCVT